MQTVSKLISTRAHLERTKGTPTQASDYCQAVEWKGKPKRDPDNMDLVHAYGDLQSVPDESIATASANQGKRNDILAVKERLDHGDDIWDIAADNEHFSAVIKYHRGYALYKHARVEERDFKTLVVVLTGAPGTGKSRAAFNFDSAFVVPASNGTQWMDGYDPQRHRCVVFDDFHASIPAHQLLRLCDEYPIQYPTKGGFVQFKPEVIVFTSNYRPVDWYDWPSIKADYAAFERRIDIWWEYFLPETEKDKNMCKENEYHCLLRPRTALQWHPQMEELIPLQDEGDSLDLFAMKRDEIPTVNLTEQKEFLNSLLRPVVIEESESDELVNVPNPDDAPEPAPWQEFYSSDPEKSHISVSSEDDSDEFSSD